VSLVALETFCVLSLATRAIEGLQACDDPMDCLIDMDIFEPQPQSPPPATMSLSISEPDVNVVTYIERLLAAINRLRGERDSLRRDVQFLESESRFTIEALEAKLSASVSSTSDKTVATIGQLKNEMDELHSHLAEISEKNAATVESKNFEIKRLGLVAQTLAVVFDYSSSQAISGTRLLLLTQDELRASQDDLMQKERHFKDVENRLNGTILDHKAMTSQRDDLLAELQRKDSQWEKDLEIARTAEKETREELEDVLHRMSEIAAHVEDVESERDSLRLQITNLMTDMHDVQEELTNAEDRYTSLQFHQLSNMTNTEATRNLRGQIEELENRVMRRTEQIGIHQHDIKRLETNLRLQEERLGEMTTELEMMAAQKDAMVEDCADARETRDEALMRVEQLEEELEGSEGRNVDNTVIVESLIATIAQTVCQAREALRLSREEVAEARDSHGQQSAVIQQLQEKETAFHKSIHEYQNEIQKLTTTLSQCQMEVEHVSALATKVQQENCELVSQLENGNLQVQDHETTINDLRRLNQELRNSLQEHQLSKPDADDAERKLVQLKLEHAEAIGVLQARLVEISSDLEEVQTRYTSAQDAHQLTIQEANSSNLELEQRLGAASKKLAELEQLREQYNDLKKEHAKQQSLLQEELTRASHSYQVLQRSRDAIEDERVRLTEDLTRIQKEHATQVNRSRDENRAVKQELEQQITSLQGRIEEQGRLLDISKREASRICDRLQEEVEARAQDEKQHATALMSERERNDKTISQLRGELETLKRNLQQTNVDLQLVEDEKLTLQQQMTAFQAEIQRSKSLSHYLEIQMKDR
jgi:chromosome segregation ATPase